MTRRRTRWRGAVVATVLLAGGGVVTGDGTLLVAAALPLVYLAYGSVATVAVPDGLTVERRIAPTPAPPGRPVSVTLSVTNETDRPLSDVRVVDQVPADLAVLDGSPRVGTTMGAGETVTVEYTLVARRGAYRFDPPRVRVRGTGAGAVATVEREPTGETRLVCRLDADAPPLEDRGTNHVGQLASDEAGDGLTFHSTREHRVGDPASRIDWRQYAKKGTLATVNYTRWVSTTVVLVVDARAPCRVAPGPGRPTAAELNAYAATRTTTAFLQAGHEVAVAVVGVDGNGPAGLAWLPPGSGREQRSRVVDLLGDALDAAPRESLDTAAQFRKVAELAGADAQLALLSPLLDEPPVTALDDWGAMGRVRTLISPDVVAENTVSGQYAAVGRKTRLARCQAAGTRTINWRRGTPLGLVIAYAFAVADRESGAATTTTRAGGGV